MAKKFLQNPATPAENKKINRRERKGRREN